MKPWHAIIAFVVGGSSAMVGAVVVAVIAALVVLYGRGLGMGQLQTVMMDIAVVAPSMLTTHGLLIFTAVITPKLAKAPVAQSLGLQKAPWPTFFMAPLGILALGPTSDGLVRFMQEHAPSLTFGALDQLEALMNSAPIWALWPLIALMPGFAEELFFRGMWQRTFGTGALALVTSAVLFAGFHMDPHHVVGVLPLGLYLAWLGARTGSTWVPITAHVFNNSVALLASKFGGEELEAVESPLWLVPVGWLIAAGAMAVIVYVMRKRETKAGRSDALALSTSEQ